MLVAIFLLMVVGDGVNHCKKKLKKRGNASVRLEREIVAATKKQQKLELKKRKIEKSAASSLETGATGSVCAVEPKQKATFSAV